MVFTLHRYIFRDLCKTFLLATAVLSLVLGLGVMLRPLRDFSVDPVNVLKLLAYTLPITLTMVIPISALLAATVNYGRLAVDNEITACRSSGISLTTLVYPALTLALLVGMATLAIMARRLALQPPREVVPAGAEAGTEAWAEEPGAATIRPAVRRPGA